MSEIQVNGKSASKMSELENLSNDELRLELLKFGFANMPVTSTTRKVLMKKLKTAHELQKSKTRRDTVAVMKASDDEDPELARGKKEKKERRATVAVVEKTKKVPATTTTQNGTNTPPKSPSRRSSRATPSKDKPVVSSSAFSLQDQSDDDVIEIIEPVVTRRSKSKTPTLAKSETVRTSTQFIRNVPIVREEDPSTEEDDRSFEVEFQEPQPVVQNRRTTALSYSKPTRNLTPTKGIAMGLGRTLSTSYNPSFGYTKVDNDENDDDEDPIDAPYLSSFAKRLSTLRAEPLDIGVNRHQKEVVQPSTSYSTTYRYSSSASQYSKLDQVQPTYRKSVGSTMSSKFDRLDKKYGVRKWVYIGLLVMLLVALYVIFT